MSGDPAFHNLRAAVGNRTDEELTVQYRELQTLKLNPNNPRQHGSRQIRQIANSITAFGLVSAIVIDENCTVIIGNGRLLAARSLGLHSIPTIQVRHLTPAQLTALAIADNKLTENSTWDDRLLAEQLKELSIHGLDLNIEITGFAMGEIDLRIEGLAGTALAEPDPADEFPPVKNGVAVSKEGDLWQLGANRVLCGNALEEACYQVLMGGERAGMAITDPPYNVPIDGHVSGLGSLRHREFAMAVGEMDSSQFQEFLRASCANLVRHSTDGSIHFVFMDWRHVGELLAAGRQTYSEFKNLCVWQKSNAGMGSLYRSGHEFVLVFKNGRSAHRNNVQLGRYGRNRTNVWNYPNTSSFGRAGEEGNLAELHPTVKPVALVADAIFDCSMRGDIVLDAFLGSGTTVIAAERTGRRCYGIELDPRYVDAIIRRWQAYTREKAVHATTGQSFDDLAAQAGGSHAR